MSLADSPSRFLCAARPFAEKRIFRATASSVSLLGTGAALAWRRSCFSSSCTRRFSAAISDRCRAAAFFSACVSWRTSLRARRTISDFNATAMFMAGILAEGEAALLESARADIRLRRFPTTGP